MSRNFTKNTFVTLALLAGLVLVGCSSQEAAPQQADNTTSGTATPELGNGDEVSEPIKDQGLIETESADARQGDIDSALAERDQFHKDQQLPMDGSPLTAVTPEQKQFVTEQRAHIESQGAAWTQEYETLILALTADACESAILNHHDVDSTTVQMHIASSPLFHAMLPEGMNDAEREQTEASMAEIMVYGMQHMCPADYAEWAPAVIELYPEHINVQ